jgi:hypothetical protein
MRQFLEKLVGPQADAPFTGCAAAVMPLRMVLDQTHSSTTGNLSTIAIDR